MSCKSQGSRLKAQSSKFKALFLNKAHGSKHKQEDFTKSRVCGFAGAYVTVGSTTWLGGSELMYIGAAEKPPPHLYGDVAKALSHRWFNSNHLHQEGTAFILGVSELPACPCNPKHRSKSLGNAMRCSSHGFQAAKEEWGGGGQSPPLYMGT